MVNINSECASKFKSLKDAKSPKYIIFGLNSDFTEIVVEKTSDATDWYDFVADLPTDACKWAAYYFDNDGGTSKILFIVWSPDDAKMKQKMIFSSNKATLRSSVDGIDLEVLATDSDEITYDTVVGRVEKVR